MNMGLSHAEPEDEEQAEAPQEEQADSLEDRHGSMQIEEVSQQHVASPADGKQETETSAGTGMMQSVMGAAKSLFGGGKPAEKVSCSPLAYCG